MLSFVSGGLSEITNPAFKGRRDGFIDSDCLALEVARKAGHLPLGTFDRGLAKLDGAEPL